ncbi:MAG: hypothetical protein LBS69_02260 [Prevotellaceae bacterium]|jgi:hypothetical protein|nr:hypothetical protein [Prevotellaceae bacterium]
MKKIILICIAFFAFIKAYAQLDTAYILRVNSIQNDSIIFISNILQHNDTSILKRNYNIEKLQAEIQNQKYINLKSFISEMTNEQRRNHIMQNTFNVDNSSSMGRQFRFGIVTDIVMGIENEIFKKNNKPKVKPSKKF